jgi:hypothetical protein
MLAYKNQYHLYPVLVKNLLNQETTFEIYGFHNPDFTYTYDKVGNVLSMVTATGSASNFYSGERRIRQTCRPNSRTVRPFS